MNPLTLIDAAGHAQQVLDLADKSALTLYDWTHINQLAAALVQILFAIEQDASLRGDIRDRARDLHHALTETMRRSCGQIEALGGFGYVKPENKELL